MCHWFIYPSVAVWCVVQNALCNTDISRPKFVIHISLERLQEVEAMCEVLRQECSLCA